MWGALRQDFSEFVSTVTTEAGDALATIDHKLDRDDDDDGDGEDAPTIDLDTGMVIDNTEDDVELPPKEEMIAFLHTCLDVYLDDLEEEDFQLNLEDKTDDITQLLEKYPDSLQVTFATLTDQVEYKDFWKRYFFRLNDERLEETYRFYEAAEREKINKARREKAAAALSSVTNFLGGAVKGMIGDDNESGSPRDQGTAGQSTASALNFFKGGRPPFVLNTAVSEDGEDDEDGNDDDDEEEELGWDDDDDEDFDDDDGDAGNANDDSNIADVSHNDDEQIEFKDAAKDKLQKDLELALLEREQLHKTVELQTEEIKRLKEASGGDDSKQVESLKMQLFEKDSELAALKARLEDTDFDDGDGNGKQPQNDEQSKLLAAKVEQLQKDLASRDSQIAQLQRELKASADGKSSDDSVALKEAQANASKAQEELNSVKQSMSKVTEENESLKKQIAAVGNDSSANNARISNMEKDLKDARSQIQDLTKAQSESSQKLQTAQTRVQALEKAHAEQSTELAQSKDLTQSMTANMETSLEALRSSLEAKEKELLLAQESLQAATTRLQEVEALLASKDSSAPRPSSPGSNSTGIKVDVPTPEPEKPPVVSSLAVPTSDDDDNGDGWGDDW